MLKRLETFLICIAVGIAAIVAANHIQPFIDVKSAVWRAPETLPVMKPVGNDFRVGLYRPARLLLQGESPYTGEQLIYPPLAAVIAIPFVILPEWNAYLIQIGLICLFDLAALFLLARCAVTAFQVRADSGAAAVLAAVFLAVLAISFTSYGFQFNLERGNFDTYPLLLSAVFLWLLIAHPEKLWLQVVVVSLATHLKVYPAIFFCIIIWKHGWKSLIPIAVCNLALLLILGPVNAFRFIEIVLEQMSSRKTTWIGNHSAYAYGSFFEWYPNRNWPTLSEAVLLFLPVALWAATAVVLFRRGFSYRRAVWLFAVSVPLMNVLPRVSYDYKLIWVYAPAVILLACHILGYLEDGRPARLLGWFFLCALLLFTSRSFSITPDILANKYPYIFLLEGLCAASAVLDRVPQKTPLPETPQVEDAILLGSQ